MGDFNAKIGDDNTGLKNVMGRYGMGARNENGEMLRHIYELQPSHRQKSLSA
jgi:hypothetical protein